MLSSEGYSLAWQASQRNQIIKIQDVNLKGRLLFRRLMVLLLMHTLRCFLLLALVFVFLAALGYHRTPPLCTYRYRV